MKKSFLTISLFALILLMSCGSNEMNDKYRMDRKFWSEDDYRHVVFTIEYTDGQENRPGYATPEKLPIFKKLVDHNNISVIVEDDALGLGHRAEFSEKMFTHYKDLTRSYSGTNREDKFVYPLEVVEILKFGLYLQYYYFNLNNELIKKEADDPDSKYIKDLVKSNQEVLIGNYSNYLGYVKQEDALTPEALLEFIDGIDTYFPVIIEEYKTASFSEMIGKTKNMIKKTKSKKVKAALQELLTKLETRND